MTELSPTARLRTTGRGSQGPHRCVYVTMRVLTAQQCHRHDLTSRLALNFCHRRGRSSGNPQPDAPNRIGLPFRLSSRIGA